MNFHEFPMFDGFLWMFHMTFPMGFPMNFPRFVVSASDVRPCGTGGDPGDTQWGQAIDSRLKSIKGWGWDLGVLGIFENSMEGLMVIF